MQTLRYHDAARRLLDQGFEDLAQGEPRKASETGWGAAAQMIKAVASSRGWQHNTHAALHRVIGRLARETGDKGIHRRFATANALHQNSYENWGDPDYVEEGLAAVRELLDQLHPLLDHRETHPLPTT